MDSSSYGINIFPKQKISEKEKFANKKDWFHSCATWMRSFSYFSSYHNQHRIPLKEMWTLENLHYRDTDPNDYNEIFNPSGNPEVTKTLGEVTNYPVEVSCFNELVSECTKRPRRIDVKVINSDYINKRNNAKRDSVTDKVMETIMNGENPAQLDQEIKQKDEYYRLNYRDSREKQYTDLLKYHANTHRFDIIEQKAIKDKIFTGEQQMGFDIINNSPYMYKIDPKYLYYSSGGASCKTQDSDRICITQYMPLSKVVDTYRKYLDEEDINEMETAYAYFTGIGQSVVDVNQINPNRAGAVSVNDLGGRVFSQLDTMDPSLQKTDFLQNNLLAGQYSGTDGSTNDSLSYAPVDRFGNIRIMRCFWKGLKKYKKVKKVTDGVEEIDYMLSDKFESDEETWEEVESAWLPAWYETTIIGEKKFVEEKEWEGNAYRDVSWELVTSPVVGYSQSHNNQNAESIMKRIKHHKMYYNLIKHEQKMAVGSNVGNVLEVDFTKFPIKMDGFSVDSHLARIKRDKLLIVDPTNAISEGSFKGVSGQYNTTGGVRNWNQIEPIQLYQEILGALKLEIEDITGVSGIRKGTQTANTVGATERNMMQSSMITEIFFKENDDFWCDALNNYIEVCKVAYRTKKPSFFNATDDISASLFDFDVDEFVNLDLGVIVADNSKEEAIKKDIQQYAQNMIINGALDVLDWVKLRRSDSLGEMEGILTKSKDDKIAEQNELQKQQAEQQKQIEELRMQNEEEKRRFAIELEQMKGDYKLEAERILAEVQLQVQEMKVTMQSATDTIKNSTDTSKISAEKEIAFSKLQGEMHKTQAKKETDLKKIENDKYSKQES